MTDETPQDPFQNNPLDLIDQTAMQYLQEGKVEYFDLFPDMSYDHLHSYAEGFIKRLRDEVSLLDDIEDEPLAAILIHGIMMGGLYQKGPEFVLTELGSQDNL